jgi:rfaE bifunctional protein nucleotidyltransferase chain/domain
MHTENKIKTQEELVGIANKLRKEGKKIVTLNGSFDILHPGHLHMIEEAKNQGDILIMALNSDSSIRKNKGPKRPINDQDFRTKMIAGLQNVDYVTTFDETTPINFLEKIKPNIHVNGSEYGEKCIEADTVKKNGGRVYIVKLLKGYSTTGIIKKIADIYSKSK